MERAAVVKLALALAVDAVGLLTWMLPVIGEIGDMIWAPISAVLIFLIFRSQSLAMLGFWEEFLPFTDFVPTATIAWVSTHWQQASQWLLARGVGAGSGGGDLLRAMEQVFGAQAPRQEEPEVDPLAPKPDPLASAQKAAPAKQAPVDRGERVMGFDVSAAGDGDVIEISAIPTDFVRRGAGAGAGAGARQRQRRR